MRAFFLVAVLLSLSVVADAALQPREAKCLDVLRDEWNVPSWTGAAATNACDKWRGIECVADGSSVGSIDLVREGLVGRVPGCLGALGNMTSLSLVANALTGPIPPELGQLSSLEHLNLGANALTGPIPPELGQLSSLKYLELWSNELVGDVPESIENLPYLSVCDLTKNKALKCHPGWTCQC